MRNAEWIMMTKRRFGKYGSIGSVVVVNDRVVWDLAALVEGRN